MSEEHAKHDAHAEGESHGSGGHGGGGHGGHGGGAHEEHEGAPEWLISFADNVALLMGFFVILLAMNMKEPTTGGIGGKEQNGGAPPMAQNPDALDMILSIRSAFNNPVSINSTAPGDAALVRRMKEKMKPTGKANMDAPPGDKPEVQSVRPTDYKKIGGTVAFGDGSASVTSQAIETINAVAAKVRGHKWIIEVRGNASAAEAFKSVGDGFKLSYMRSFNVAEALNAAGVGWDQIRVVACGDGDRLNPLAYSAEGHRPNQRVEIVVTGDLAPDDPHQSEANAAGKD